MNTKYRILLMLLPISIMFLTTPKVAKGADLADVTITNQGTTGNVSATFGHVFKKGDVSSSNTVGAKLENGTPINLQVDKKTTHADGSLRHAVLTANLGSVNSGQTTKITLFSKTGELSGSPVGLSDLLATSFDTVVSLNIGGTIYTASARDFLATKTPITWLSGPESSEWIVGGALKDGSSNPHPHLAAYFHVRAYAGSPINQVRVDTVVENGWTKVAGATSYTISSAKISIPGKSDMVFDNLTQYHHTRWHATGWWGNALNIYTKFDTQYLRDTLAVPNYDNAITIQEATLNRYAQTIVPMGRAGLRTNWGDTGYDPQIGLLPEWDAAFIISGDQRAFNGVLANASAGGSFSYHYRDETTGGLPSIDSYPTLSEQGPSGGLIIGSGGNANSHDTSHSPDIGYLAYLLTGDFYYLEELQFLANWCMLYNNASYRGNSNGVFTGQNRGQAWSIRTLSHAAAATPDGFFIGGINYKNYFVNKLINNITDRQTKWADGPTNILGAFQDYNWPSHYSPWQNDFFVAVFNHIVELGFSEGTTMRNWLNRWPAGRLGTSNTEFCYVYATKYEFAPAGIVDSSGNYYTGFRELYAALNPAESASPCPANSLMQSAAYPSSATGYYSNMQPAVAMAADAGQVTTEQWNIFKSAGAANMQTLYSADPVWDVVPRSPVSIDTTPPLAPSGLVAN